MQQQPLKQPSNDDHLSADDAVELIHAISTRSVGRAARAIFNNNKLRSFLGSLFAAKFVEVSLCDSPVAGSSSNAAPFALKSGQQHEQLLPEIGAVHSASSPPPPSAATGMQPQVQSQSVLRGATVRTLLQQMRRKQRHPQTTSRIQSAATAEAVASAASAAAAAAAAAAAWSAESDGDDEMPHSATGGGGGGGCGGSSSSDAAEAVSRSLSVAMIGSRRRAVTAVADAASSTATEPKLRAAETVLPQSRQTFAASTATAEDRQTLPSPPEPQLHRVRLERWAAAAGDANNMSPAAIDLRAEARSTDDAVAPGFGPFGKPRTGLRNKGGVAAVAGSGVSELLVAGSDGWLLSPGAAIQQQQQLLLQSPPTSGFGVRASAVGLLGTEPPSDGDSAAAPRQAAAVGGVAVAPPLMASALVCELCGRRFSKQSALMQHRRWHTGEKPAQPYRCELCGRGFSSRNSLHIHGAIHSGEKRYACEICNKRFSTQTYLWHHRAVHSDARPYSCEFCACDFKMRSSLNNHLARRHAVFSSPSARTDGGGSPGCAADAASTATASDGSAVGDQPSEKREPPASPASLPAGDAM